MGAVPVRTLVRGTWFPPDVNGVRGFSSKRAERSATFPSRLTCWSLSCRFSLPRCSGIAAPVDNATSPDSIAFAKDAFRKRMRFRRDTFVQQRAEWERSVAFSAVPPPLRVDGAGRTVAGYLAVGSEADGQRIWAALQASGWTLAMPHHATRQDVMTFVPWTVGAPVHAGPFGTPQPVTSNGDVSASVLPHIAFFPLLAFDRIGGRLGQGGGHYDRTFAACPDAYRIGLAWSIQEVDAVPMEPHDLRLHAILTEGEWLELTPFPEAS